MNSSHKGQWRGALMFSLICVWINGWVNKREAGDLRRHRAHYDFTVMRFQVILLAIWRNAKWPEKNHEILRHYNMVAVCVKTRHIQRDIIQLCRDIISTNHSTNNMSRYSRIMSLYKYNQSEHRYYVAVKFEIWFNFTKLCGDLFRILSRLWLLWLVEIISRHNTIRSGHNSIRSRNDSNRSRHNSIRSGQNSIRSRYIICAAIGWNHIATELNYVALNVSSFDTNGQPYLIAQHR